VCYASHVENPYLRSLIASLIEGSEEFRQLWGQHPTAAHWPESITFNLAPYGHLQFTSVRFRFIGQEDRFIVLLAPETPETVAAMTQMTRDRARTRRSGAAAVRPPAIGPIDSVPTP
jgi:hypothetical protein